MYACPNCAANLRYDIERKKLHCASCDTSVDPYSFHKDPEENAAEDYEVTVFTCTQCGGEIISDDTTAATFCSYCGTATILESRISRERRPSHIIPFSQTMENCKKSYKSLLRKAIFTPKELKDPDHIEKFRGIYMPYWVYSFEKNSPTTFHGKKSYQRGDYLITRHYAIEAHVDACYEGISFDASSTFADSLSSAIAPFDLNRGMPFNPSFLSGFYADTSDVDRMLYYGDGADLFVRDCARTAMQDRTLKKFGVGKSSHSTPESSLGYDEWKSHLALFPVWFLAYRKDDRVAYAVVNGQTGKAAADLPIDIKRYLLISFLLAVPIFVLLNMFFTFKPGTVLLWAALLAVLSVIICSTQINSLISREKMEDDKGMKYKSAAGTWFPPEEKDNSYLRKNHRGVISDHRIETTKLLRIIPPILMVLVSFLPTISSFYIFMFLGIFSLCILPLVLAVTSASTKRRSTTKSNKTRNLSLTANWNQKLSALIKPGISVILALLIAIWSPVNDIFYYIGAILCMLGVAWAQMDIMKRHNRLTTRKLPQLGRRGGDENA
ncbi:MAG: hypothetical protein IKL04_08670 [Lachnospiraceae bacterium]|nr:hypothetical protein [Lachnospiraceae bacterium]